MIIAIINAIAIVSMATGVVFFIVSYYGFTHNEDDTFTEVEELFGALLSADRSQLTAATLRWAVFPPLLMAMLAAFAAYIITRRED